jgi:hypothetical protein
MSLLTTQPGGDWREPIYWLAKVNLKTITHLTGAQIAALSLATVPRGKVYRCTTTGSGFTAGNFYQINPDRDGFKVTYGNFSDILQNSIPETFVFNEPFPRKFMFRQNMQGGGTITDDDSSGGFKLETSGATNGRAMARLHGNCAEFDFGRTAVLKFRMQFTDARQCLARFGVNTENYDNPQDTTKHFCLEIDNSSDTDSFWWISSSDGTVKTTLVTPNLPVTSNNTYRYVMVFVPGIRIEFWVNGILTSTKTNNIPSTGGATANALVILVKTRHNNNKELDIRQVIIASANNDNY